MQLDLNGAKDHSQAVLRSKKKETLRISKTHGKYVTAKHRIQKLMCDVQLDVVATCCAVDWLIVLLIAGRHCV